MTTATTVSPTLREPQLLGQTVVVIGGSSGIGLEMARRARAEGAGVVLTGRNPERLQQAALERRRWRPAAGRCLTPKGGIRGYLADRGTAQRLLFLPRGHQSARLGLHLLRTLIPRVIGRHLHTIVGEIQWQK